MPALALLGTGAGLDASLQALSEGPAGWRLLLCTPGAPADEALVQAWEAARGRRVERVEAPLDATPAQRLSRLCRAAADDVLVLAPGAMPAPGSLEGIARALDADARVASATPWSNDGELTAFPRIGERQPLPDDLGPLAVRLRQARGDPPLPIGGCHAVGLSGKALAAVGGLDDASYFSTYATLVDLFLRQSEFGWRHLLAARCYVGAMLEQGPGMGDMQQLTARYPGYARQVAEFLMHDPLRALRAELATSPEEARVPASPMPQGDLFG